MIRLCRQKKCSNPFSGLETESTCYKSHFGDVPHSYWFCGSLFFILHFPVPSQDTLLPLGVVGTERPSEGKPAGPGKRYAPFLPGNKEEEGSLNV